MKQKDWLATEFKIDLSCICCVCKPVIGKVFLDPETQQVVALAFYCPSCHSTLASIDIPTIVRTKACDVCHKKSYLTRTDVDEETKQLVLCYDCYSAIEVWRRVGKDYKKKKDNE
jgi:hypothetical protein